MIRSSFRAFFAATGVLSAVAASPAAAFDIVDGAACAHLGSQIDALGVRNEALLNEISDMQNEATSKGRKDASAAAIAVHDALVELRQTWIKEYEQKCSGASLPVNDFRKVCRPAGGAFDLRGTSFCKPIVESKL